VVATLISNEAYDEAISELSHKVPEVHQSRSAATKQDDYYRGFRTRLVMAWIGSNGLLVALICSSAIEKKLTMPVIFTSNIRADAAFCSICLLPLHVFAQLDLD
jgi:hypothetical protein